LKKLINMTAAVNQQSYSRLENEEPVEPFNLWCKRKIRNPFCILGLLGFVGGLVALAALHPWDPPAKEQFTLAVSTNYFGWQEFALPPYLLRFTGFVRLSNETDTVDVDMQFLFEPYINTELTVFSCPGEPYTIKSKNESTTVMSLVNAHKKGDCMDTFLDAFVAEITKYLPLPIPGLGPIIDQILDGVLKVNVNSDLVYDRYTNAVHIYMNIESLIKVDVKAEAGAVTPLPTSAPTLSPTPPTEAPTPKPTPTPTPAPTRGPTDTPTPQPTPDPNSPPTTSSPTTAAPTAIQTTSTASPTVQARPHPVGTFVGKKSEVGHEINGKMVFASAVDEVDVAITVTGTSVNVTCSGEPYSSGAADDGKTVLSLTDTKSSDCLQKALTKNDLKINSISWDDSSETVTLSANWQSILPLSLEMKRTE